MRNLIICITLMLASTYAKAEDMISFGLGAFHSAESGPTETKLLRLAHREDFDEWSFWQIEWGLWIDGAGGGRSSSTFAAGSIGLKVDLQPVFITNSLGLAVIGAPDVYLGGSFPQFTEEFGIGIRGINKASIGLSYKHFSSAGLVMPNMGRDFFILSLGVGL